MAFIETYKRIMHTMRAHGTIAIALLLLAQISSPAITMGTVADVPLF